MYRVDEATCTGCGECVEACPAGALVVADGRAHIHEAICAACGSCAGACPQGAIMMADAANPAPAVIRPGVGISAVVPAAASEEEASLALRPEIQVLPAERHRSQLWSMVGSALVWAARELLPEVIAAWRASHDEVLQSISYKPVAPRRRAPARQRNGHRYRWGRA
jgi:Fe-S-cluster-containing hydrogenase component 2